MKMQTFPLVHPSLAACARQTLAQEGVRGLYVGTLPALAAVVAENSVLFMAYGATQRAVARSLGVRQASQAESGVSVYLPRVGDNVGLHFLLAQWTVWYSTDFKLLKQRHEY